MSLEKNRRGRPATGRSRDKKLTLQVTEEERKLIKDYAQAQQLTLTDLLLMAVKHQIH